MISKPQFLMPKSIKISYPSVRNTNFDTETKKTEK